MTLDTNGPDAPPTPADDSDLHDNPNPFASGETLPNVVDVRGSNWTATPGIAGVLNGSGPAGYYANAPATSPNPYRDGAGSFSTAETDAAASIHEGFGGVYDRQPPLTAPDPVPDGIRRDEGFGSDGNGNSV